MLRFIEECPKGVVTLVTRIVHTISEKSKPTQELLARVRRLYQKKVSDVRVLIPVISGLSKQEILSTLPKFLKMNPVVLKEVFNRILKIGPEFSCNATVVTPIELLLALHTIDLEKCELKGIVKATSLCLSEKNVYAQDIIATCLQKLVEIDPLPTNLTEHISDESGGYVRVENIKKEKEDSHEVIFSTGSQPLPPGEEDLPDN